MVHINTENVFTDLSINYPRAIIWVNVKGHSGIQLKRSGAVKLLAALLGLGFSLIYKDEQGSHPNLRSQPELIPSQEIASLIHPAVKVSRWAILMLLYE